MPHFNSNFQIGYCKARECSPGLMYQLKFNVSIFPVCFPAVQDDCEGFLSNQERLHVPLSEPYLEFRQLFCFRYLRYLRFRHTEGTLFYIGGMPDNIWEMWYSELKEKLTAALGYEIGEPEEGFEFKYWE